MGGKISLLYKINITVWNQTKPNHKILTSYIENISADVDLFKTLGGEAVVLHGCFWILTKLWNTLSSSYILNRKLMKHSFMEIPAAWQLLSFSRFVFKPKWLNAIVEVKVGIFFQKYLVFLKEMAFSTTLSVLQHVESYRPIWNIWGLLVFPILCKIQHF